jgi:pilus assembly protein CpaB
VNFFALQGFPSMRNIRPLGALLLALVLGLAAAAYAASWLQQQNASNTLQVIVAQRDLQMGTRLQPDMLQTLAWPKAAAIQDPLTTLDQAVGRVIHMPVLRGEPLLQSKLAPIGEKGGLSSVLAPGQRAVTVKVNEIVGVAGFALPGNFVDVMVNTPDSQNQPVSKIVIERIQVLAVAQDVSTNESKPRVVNAVTLQVSPQQAEQIDLARSVGTLSLVLRSHGDNLPVQTAGARKLDLLPQVATTLVAALAPKSPSPRPRAARPLDNAPHAEPPAPPPAAVPEPVRLEVIRGLSLSQE